jgi:hypothetical protein
LAWNAGYGSAATAKTQQVLPTAPASASLLTHAPDKTNGEADAGWAYSSKSGDLAEDVHLGMPRESRLPARAGVVARSSKPSSTSFNYQLVPDASDHLNQAVRITLRPTITGNNTTAHGSVHVVLIVSYNGVEVYHYDHTTSGAAAHLPPATYKTFGATIGATFQVTMSVTAEATGGAGEDIRGHVNLDMIYDTHV